MQVASPRINPSQVKQGLLLSPLQASESHPRHLLDRHLESLSLHHLAKAEEAMLKLIAEPPPTGLDQTEKTTKVSRVAHLTEGHRLADRNDHSEVQAFLHQDRLAKPKENLGQDVQAAAPEGPSRDLRERKRVDGVDVKKSCSQWMRQLTPLKMLQFQRVKLSLKELPLR